MTKITSLSALRANRNSFEKITKDIESLTKKKEYAQDERMWQCATDDAKNGSAIIRFLPAIVDDNKPYVRMYTHNFKGPGGYYIENCLTTIEKEDPCCISNDALWKTGIKENQELVSGINGKNARKRKLSYYANVYIVSDPANPENVGKVKIFKFGAKIMEKLLAALKPEFEDEKPVDPFNIFDGANFRLLIKEVKGFANFDSSKFSTPSELAKTDEDMIEILNQRHNLEELIAEDKFKPFAVLQARLDKVLGTASAPTAPNNDLSAEDEEFLKSTAKAASKAPEKTKAPVAPTIDAADLPDAGDSEEDDDMAYFQKLANS